MDQQTLVYLVWLIPLLPLTAFFLIMLFTRGHDRLSHTIAIGAMTLSLIFAQIVFWNAVAQGGSHEAAAPAAAVEHAAEAPSATVEHSAETPAAAEGEHARSSEHGSYIESSIPWLPQGLNTLNMGVLVDPLTAVMLFMVPLACLMIFIYSVGYSNFNKKHDAHDQARFPAAQRPRADVQPLLRVPLAVRGRDVDAGGGRQPVDAVHRLGSDGPVLVSADRVLVRPHLS